MSPSRLLFVQQIAFPLELSSQECGPDLSSGGSFPWRKPSVMLVCFDLRPLRSHKNTEAARTLSPWPGSLPTVGDTEKQTLLLVFFLAQLQSLSLEFTNF